MTSAQVWESGAPKSKDERYFEAYRERLEGESLKLAVSLHILGILDNAHADAAYEPVLDRAPAFFAVSRAAHFGFVIVLSHKLFSNERGAKTLPRLVNWVESHIALFQPAEFARRRGLPLEHDHVRVRAAPNLAEARAQLAAIGPVLQSIKLRRDKYWAHLDGAYFLCPERFEVEAQLPRLELKAIPKAFDSVIALLSSCFDGRSASCLLMNAGDLRELLRLAKRGLEVGS